MSLYDDEFGKPYEPPQPNDHYARDDLSGISTRGCDAGCNLCQRDTTCSAWAGIILLAVAFGAVLYVAGLR